jgi:hypothetical protein
MQPEQANKPKSKLILLSLKACPNNILSRDTLWLSCQISGTHNKQSTTRNEATSCLVAQFISASRAQSGEMRWISSWDDKSKETVGLLLSEVGWRRRRSEKHQCRLDVIFSGWRSSGTCQRHRMVGEVTGRRNVEAKSKGTAVLTLWEG